MTWQHGKVPPVKASTIPNPVNSKKTAQNEPSRLKPESRAPTSASADKTKGRHGKIHGRPSDLSPSHLHSDMRKKLSHEVGK